MIASSLGVGLTYHLSRLSIGLKKKGHDVSVLSGPREQAEGSSAELMKAGIEHFTSDHIDNSGIYSTYKGKEEIRKILEITDVDVIHANGVTHTLKACLAARSFRYDIKPATVTSIHSVPRDGLLQKPKWAVMRIILNAGSDMILPVSNNTMELLKKHGLNSKKTIAVHNAVDVHVFDDGVRRARIGCEREKSYGPNIVYVANLIPRKGQEYYLMGAAEVLKKHHAEFYVVGSGPQRKYLEEFAHHLGIEEHVVFTGRIPQNEIYYFLSVIADVCVSPSLGELFPFYILECMASRKPIVTTNVGGVSEAVIDGVNGYLVPPRDPTSLAKAILKLINDPDKARKMGLKGRGLVEERFSMDVITRKLSDVYELALRRKLTLGNRCVP